MRRDYKSDFFETWEKGLILYLLGKWLEAKVYF